MAQVLRGGKWVDVDPSLYTFGAAPVEDSDGVVGGAVDALQGMGWRAAYNIGDALRGLTGEAIGRGITDRATQGVRENTPESEGFSSEGVGNVLGQGLGSLGLGAGVAAAFPPAAPVTVPLAMGLNALMQSYAGSRMEQEQAGETARGRAIATAIPSAAIETALGPERMLVKMAGLIGKEGLQQAAKDGTDALINLGMKGATKQFVKQGAVENLEEIMQMPLEQYGGRGMAGITADALMEGAENVALNAPNVFVGSGLLGGGMQLYQNQRADKLKALKDDLLRQETDAADTAKREADQDLLEFDLSQQSPAGALDALRAETALQDTPVVTSPWDAALQQLGGQRVGTTEEAPALAPATEWDMLKAQLAGTAIEDVGQIGERPNVVGPMPEFVGPDQNAIPYGTQDPLALLGGTARKGYSIDPTQAVGALTGRKQAAFGSFDAEETQVPFEQRTGDLFSPPVTPEQRNERAAATRIAEQTNPENAPMVAAHAETITDPVAKSILQNAVQSVAPTNTPSFTETEALFLTPEQAAQEIKKLTPGRERNELIAKITALSPTHGLDIDRIVNKHNYPEIKNDESQTVPENVKPVKNERKVKSKQAEVGQVADAVRPVQEETRQEVNTAPIPVVFEDTPPPVDAGAMQLARNVKTALEFDPDSLASMPLLAVNEAIKTITGKPATGSKSRQKRLEQLATLATEGDVNAVQKQTTSEVDVQPETRDGEALGEGNEVAKKTAKKGKKPFGSEVESVAPATTRAAQETDPTSTEPVGFARQSAKQAAEAALAAETATRNAQVQRAAKSKKVAEQEAEQWWGEGFNDLDDDVKTQVVAAIADKEVRVVDLEDMRDDWQSVSAANQRTERITKKMSSTTDTMPFDDDEDTSPSYLRESAPVDVDAMLKTKEGRNKLDTIMVQHRVWDEEAGKWVEQEMSALKALEDIESDLNALREFKACLGG